MRMAVTRSVVVPVWLVVLVGVIVVVPVRVVVRLTVVVVLVSLSRVILMAGTHDEPRCPERERAVTSARSRAAGLWPTTAGAGRRRPHQGRDSQLDALRGQLLPARLAVCMYTQIISDGPG